MSLLASGDRTPRFFETKLSRSEALDKNKIIEAAAKLVAKGAYDKAIKEYQKVLDVDPKDVRILQKMGELYQKKNDNPQAAFFFTKVAESYSNDGFFLKAVALYKQVLKLDPSLVEVNIKLAELHQQLQLMSEAMAYFQIVANHYDKSGDTKKSLDVLKKMVDLDPDNVASRVKLADLYVREGLTQDAVGEFQKAAEHLKRNNRIDDYLRVAERISGHEPNNLGLAKELAELYLQRGDQKRALAKLQVCFKADPRDIDTLRLLATAFQGLGQTSKTLSVYKELARAYEERGQQQEAEATWAQVTAIDPSDPDVQARSPAAQAQPEAAPADEEVDEQAPSWGGQPSPTAATSTAPAYQPASPPPGPPKPKGENIGKLLTETDVYVKYGLHDKALEHLRKVFALEPENLEAHEKAYAIYVGSNNHAQAAEQLLNVLRLHTRTGDAVRAQPYLQAMLEQNPGHPEVPAFVAALKMSGGTRASAAAAPPATDLAEDAILVDSNDDDVIVADEQHDEVISGEVAMSGEEPLEAAEVVSEVEASPEAQPPYDLEPPPVADEDPHDAQVVSDFEAEAPAVQAEPEPAELRALGDDVEEASTGRHAIPDDEDEPPTQANVIPMTTVPVRRPPLTTQPGGPGGLVGLGDEGDHDAPTRVSRALDPALRSAATATSPARPSARAGSGKQPPHAGTPTTSPAVAAKGHGAVTAVNSATSALTAKRPAYEPPARQAPIEEPVEAPPDEEPASEECDEATFFVEQGLYDEAREILETVLIAYPDHPRATSLLAQVEAGAAGGGPAAATAPPSEGNGESRDAFDLAQELANELGDFPEAAQEPAQSEDYQVSVDEVFAEFKKGLEKVVKPEDVDTHYDLGIAYKEMGLFDDAVGEFTIARKGCQGKRKEIDCLTMIGMLQSMKGDFAAAVDALLQGLASEHSRGDTEKALRYELGMAYESGGQNGKALGQFLKVQALDDRFREVAEVVTRLSAITAPEDDGEPAAPTQKPPRGGARKVGYV